MKTILFLALIGTVSTVLVLNRPRPEERAIEIVARASASETPAATSVALQSMDDIKLAADIRTVLLKDARVAPVSDRVTVVVRGGVVTLQGKVETREQRSIVEDDTRAVPGVERIDDLIVTRE